MRLSQRRLPVNAPAGWCIVACIPFLLMPIPYGCWQSSLYDFIYLCSKQSCGHHSRPLPDIFLWWCWSAPLISFNFCLALPNRLAFFVLHHLSHIWNFSDFYIIICKISMSFCIRSVTVLCGIWYAYSKPMKFLAVSGSTTFRRLLGCYLCQGEDWKIRSTSTLVFLYQCIGAYYIRFFWGVFCTPHKVKMC